MKQQCDAIEFHLCAFLGLPKVTKGEPIYPRLPKVAEDYPRLPKVNQGC